MDWMIFTCNWHVIDSGKKDSTWELADENFIFVLLYHTLCVIHDYALQYIANKKVHVHVWPRTARVYPNITDSSHYKYVF
jgi:hypothetical protein